MFKARKKNKSLEMKINYQHFLFQKNGCSQRYRTWEGEETNEFNLKIPESSHSAFFIFFSNLAFHLCIPAHSQSTSIYGCQSLFRKITDQSRGQILLVAHCTKMRQVPPGGTAEERTLMVKEGRDGFTEEGTCEEGVDGSVGVGQLEGEV